MAAAASSRPTLRRLRRSSDRTGNSHVADGTVRRIRGGELAGRAADRSRRVRPRLADWRCVRGPRAGAGAGSWSGCRRSPAGGAPDRPLAGRSSSGGRRPPARCPRDRRRPAARPGAPSPDSARGTGPTRRCRPGGGSSCCIHTCRGGRLPGRSTTASYEMKAVMPDVISGEILGRACQYRGNC